MPWRWSAGPALTVFGGSSWTLHALVSLPFNARDDRVLLSVSLGVAWLALGISWAGRHKVRQAA